MLGSAIGRRLGTHGLALLCVLAPLVFGYGALVATALLLPQELAQDLNYQFLSKEVSVQSSAMTEGTFQGKEQKTAATKPDPAILLLARDIHGRTLYGVASGFLYLASVCAFTFGFIIVARKSKSVKVAILAALAFSIMAYLIVMSPSAIERLRPLVVEGILDAAPKAQPPINLLTTNGSLFETILLAIFSKSRSGLSATVIALVRLNSVIALTSVGMLLSALASISVLRGDEQRTRKQAHDDLRDRLTNIHVFLGLGAVLLVIAVAASRLLIQWATSLLIESQEIAIAPLGNALNQLFGATCTLILIAAATPAIAAFFLDRQKYYQKWPEPLDAEPAAVEIKTGKRGARRIDDLRFATTASVGGVIGVFGPLMTPHAMQLLAGIFEVGVHRAILG
jgi:hypothetical protein